jgi:hypothetical protein
MVMVLAADVVHSAELPLNLEWVAYTKHVAALHKVAGARGASRDVFQGFQVSERQS